MASINNSTEFQNIFSTKLPEKAESVEIHPNGDVTLYFDKMKISYQKKIQVWSVSVHVFVQFKKVDGTWAERIAYCYNIDPDATIKDFFSAALDHERNRVLAIRDSNVREIATMIKDRLSM